MSFSIVTGYFWKSLGSLNWVGFTKILQTVHPVTVFDISISDICPVWSAPIVGTKPMVFPLDRCSCNQPDKSPALLNKIIFLGFYTRQKQLQCRFNNKKITFANYF